VNKNILRLKKAGFYFLKELRSDPYKLPYMGNKYYCPVCKTNLAYFNQFSKDILTELDKYQYVYSLFLSETLNYINFECPKCRAIDRDRLYAMYFDKYFDNLNHSGKYNLLDIAPSVLKKYLLGLPFINYRSADLYMPGVDDKVDLTDMNIYEDNRFDIFICSHVLEHVKDDKKAIAELYRVLKPAGWGIAMVPIMLSLEETLEDDKIVSVADKWKYYGQDDHVRMYSKKGFTKNLKEAGFAVTEYGVDYFGMDQYEKNGIHPRSILYIVNKL
jgi:SAM-dependent methyltransferase